MSPKTAETNATPATGELPEHVVQFIEETPQPAAPGELPHRGAADGAEALRLPAGQDAWTPCRS